MHYKIRVLHVPDIKRGQKEANYCITIPKEIAKFFNSETKFFVERTGSRIVFSSGASFIPKEEELRKLKIENFAI